MINVNCKFCNKEFLTHKCWIKRGRGKYCSRTCKYKDSPTPEEAIRIRKEKVLLGLIKPIVRNQYHKKYCIRCKKEFYVYSSDIRKGGGKFCSRECYFIWKKGKPNGLKGYKWPEEQRKKKSEWCIKNNQKPKPKYGADNNKWKGGVTKESEKIRKSDKYITWRNEVYKRDRWTCVLCGQIGGKLNADHIKPFSLFPELRFDLNNGRTLCKKCHVKTETYGWKFYNLNMKEY